MAASPRTWALVMFAGFFLGVHLAMWGYAAPTAVTVAILLGAVELSEALRERGEWRIREALRRADIGICTAADYVGMDPSDFEKALRRKDGRKLDLWRLEMLPQQFWREYWPLIAQDKGVPALFHTFVQVLPIIQKESA